MQIVKLARACLMALSTGLLAAAPAHAVEAVPVGDDPRVIYITSKIESFTSDSNVIQIATPPDKDGIVRRIAVRAKETGSRHWIVFALTNTTNEEIERLLVAPPGAARIVAITASQGARPELDDSFNTQVFTLTLDPGTTITFVVELGGPDIPELTLWAPNTFLGGTRYKG